MFGQGRKFEMLKGELDSKVGVASLLVPPRERTREGGGVCKPLYIRGWDRLWEEKTQR